MKSKIISVFTKYDLSILQNIRQKGFLHLLTANVLIQLFAFSSQLLVAGILVPDDLGRIKIIQTYYSIFLIFAGMGFNASTLKLCSENRTQIEENQIFRSALLFTLISTVCFYITILTLNYFNAFSTDKLINWLLPLGLFPMISNSLFMVFVSYFQAVKKIKLLSKLTVSNKIISIILILALTYLYGIYGYYIAYNLSFILILIVCFRVVRVSFPNKSLLIKKLSLLPYHWKYAKTSMLAYLMSETSAYVDILFISIFIKDMHQIGFYSFAATITVIFRLFPNTVQQITIPYFSSLAKNKDDFSVVFKRYNKILFRAIGITLIAALLITPSMVNLIFSGKYDESMRYFPLLAISWSIRQLAQLQNGAIFGIGKIQYNVYTSVISLFFNIIFTCISLYYFQILGAAYASILGSFVFYLSSSYFFNKAKREL